MPSEVVTGVVEPAESAGCVVSTALALLEGGWGQGDVDRVVGTCGMQEIIGKCDGGGEEGGGMSAKAFRSGCWER